MSTIPTAERRRAEVVRNVWGKIICILAIYAPLIYTAPCVMLLMRAASITRASGRGLGPGNWEFSGPVKWHRTDWRVPFGAKKVEISRAQPPPTCPSNGCCPHQNHYAQGRINYRCIVGFMYKSPRVTLKGVSYIGFRAHTIPPVQLSNITTLVRFSNIALLPPPSFPPI